MTMLARWEPFPEMDTLPDAVERMLRGTWRAGDGARARGFSPAVDVHEDAERFVISADLPGFDKDAIAVTFENGVLTVSGRRGLAREERREGWHLAERAEGTFSRSFTLPATVDGERLEAEYRDGVLAVTLPKRPEARPRQVAVKVK